MTIREALDTLGLPNGGNQSDVKQAYRALSRALHIDLHQDKSLQERSFLESALKRVNLSNDVLQREFRRGLSFVEAEFEDDIEDYEQRIAEVQRVAEELYCRATSAEQTAKTWQEQAEISEARAVHALYCLSMAEERAHHAEEKLSNREKSNVLVGRITTWTILASIMLLISLKPWTWVLPIVETGQPGDQVELSPSSTSDSENPAPPLPSNTSESHQEIGSPTEGINGSDQNKGTIAAQTMKSEGIPASTHRVGGGVTAPVPIYKIEPKYSEAARNARIQGTTVLSVIIDSAGQATNIKALRELGWGLDQQAMDAVSTWRFRPATKDGKPVAVHATIEVNFRLPGVPSPVPQTALSDDSEQTKVGSDDASTRLVEHLRETEQKLAMRDYDGALVAAEHAVRVAPNDAQARAAFDRVSRIHMRLKGR